MNNKKISTLFLLALITFSTVIVASTNIEPAQSTPNYRLSGYVYDVNGYPASHAYLYLLDPTTGGSTDSGFYTDYYGFYSEYVTSGTYEIVATLFGTTQSYYQKNVVISGDTTKNITLVSGFMVSGYVYDSSGQPVLSAIITLNNNTWTAPSIRTDGLGYYEIPAPPGTYTLNVRPPEYSYVINYQNNSFTISRNTTYNIVLQTGYKVSGTIHYPSGESFYRVTTALVNGSGYMFSSSRFSSSPYAASYYIVAPAGTYTLQAKMNSTIIYAEANVTLNADMTKDLTLISASISPSSAILDVGQSYPYTATAVGGGSGNYASYNWYVNDTAKAVTSSPTFNFSPTEAGTYVISAVVIDSMGAHSALSTTATANVNPALTPSELSATFNAIDLGQISSLTATAASGGTGPYSYQWYIKAPSEANYSIISGATWLYYTFITSQSTEVGKWSFVLNATDSASSPNTVSSEAVSVWVSKAPTVAVIPEIAVANEGHPITFTALVSGGAGSMAYEWFLDNAKVGDNNNNYNYIATAGSHSVYVKVTDSANPPLSATSNTVAISINPPLVAPSVSAIAPAIDQGQSFTLNSTAPVNGTAPYTYQWFARSPNGVYTAVSGATSAICSIPTASNITSGVWYFVLHVTDSASTPVTVTSNIITVTVNSAPSVTVSPITAAFNLGQSATFSATAAGGSGTYTGYQWYVNGTIQQGQNATTFSFSPASTGSYSITATVTDSLNGVSSQSAAAQIQVSPAPTPTPTPPTPTVTPTQTPQTTATITPSPKPSTTPTATPTENPTTSPTPTPTQNVMQAPDSGTYVLIIVALIVVIVIIGAFAVLKKTKKL